MHGLGNDFVIVDSRQDGFIPDIEFRRLIADRRLGVGCDQLIFLLPPKDAKAELYLDMYNSDGSSLGACGNATRCVARLLFEESGKAEGVIQTVAGLLPVKRADAGLVEVDIAQPRFGWRDIPLAKEMDTLRLDLNLGPLQEPCAVNVGNPHAVFFVEDAEAVPLDELGQHFEHHPIFPDRANIEVVQILAPDRIRMRVWERGAGITPACGTGACATLVAAVRRGLAERKAEIILDGGSLWVEWREVDDRVILTGGASLSFSGAFAPELWDMSA